MTISRKGSHHKVTCNRSFDFSLPNSLFCNDYVKVRALIKSCVGCAHLRPAPQVLVPGRRKIKSFSTFPLGHFSIYCSVLSSVDMGTLIQTWLCKVTCLPSRETFYLITIRVYRVCKVRAVNKWDKCWICRNRITN